LLIPSSILVRHWKSNRACLSSQLYMGFPSSTWPAGLSKLRSAHSTVLVACSNHPELRNLRQEKERTHWGNPGSCFISFMIHTSTAHPFGCRQTAEWFLGEGDTHGQPPRTSLVAVLFRITATSHPAHEGDTSASGSMEHHMHGGGRCPVQVRLRGFWNSTTPTPTNADDQGRPPVFPASRQAAHPLPCDASWVLETRALIVQPAFLPRRQR
jgi:hypothetical protein